MSELKDFTDFVGTIVWPAVAVGTLVAFRRPLARFLDILGQRATKVSVYEVAIELATIPEFAPTWSSGSTDVRQLTPAHAIDSGSDTLFKQLTVNIAADYAIVDLGKGHQWLTSRLFIFAVMLERMRGLRCFVFLETRGDVRRRFLGTASPDKVRWALARQYPWLEAAFAQAYSAIAAYAPETSNDPYVFSDVSALQPQTSKTLIQNFLLKIQLTATPPVDGIETWESLSNGPLLWERAKWLNGDRLEQDLQGVLQDSWYLDSPDTPSAKRMEAILRREGPFVALVEEERRFKRLVDRQALLEQWAVNQGIPSADRSPQMMGRQGT